MSDEPHLSRSEVISKSRELVEKSGNRAGALKGWATRRKGAHITSRMGRMGLNPNSSGNSKHKVASSKEFDLSPSEVADMFELGRGNSNTPANVKRMNRASPRLEKKIDSLSKDPVKKFIIATLRQDAAQDGVPFDAYVNNGHTYGHTMTINDLFAYDLKDDTGNHWEDPWFDKFVNGSDGAVMKVLGELFMATSPTDPEYDAEYG